MPDRVLRWIGGHQEALGDMGAERDSKAAFGMVVGSATSATSAGVGTLGVKPNKGRSSRS